MNPRLGKEIASWLPVVRSGHAGALMNCESEPVNPNPVGHWTDESWILLMILVGRESCLKARLVGSCAGERVYVKVMDESMTSGRDVEGGCRWLLRVRRFIADGEVREEMGIWRVNRLGPCGEEEEKWIVFLGVN
jgi:hypothetical protein